MFLKCFGGVTLRIFSKNKYVLKFNMSLYGLRQASFNWFSFLTKFLLENGFTQSYMKPCLFYNDDIIILIYVDDTLFIAKNQSSLNHILSAFSPQANIPSHRRIRHPHLPRYKLQYNIRGNHHPHTNNSHR